MVQEDKSRLDSWKEIAAYLGRDVRTATRWEKEKGLPVHRVPGGKHHTVFAYRNEIDAWLNHQTASAPNGVVGDKPQKISWRRKGALGVGLLGLVVLAAVPLTRRSDPAQVERIGFRGSEIVAWDARGEEAWTYRFEASLIVGKPGSPGYLNALTRVVDLDADGYNEALVVARTLAGPNPTDPDRTQLICFSPQGKVLWTYEPDLAFTFGGIEYKGPWPIFATLVVPASPRPLVWVALGHHLWFASFVAKIDPSTGQGQIQFVNSGTLYALGYVENEQGSWLLPGGFNSEYEQGILAVMDASQPFAASPQTPDSRYDCESCPEGSPARYLLFPRSELNRLTKTPLNEVYEVKTVPEGVKVSTKELSGAARAIYEFPPDLDTAHLRVVFTSPYWMEHEVFEKDGALDHSAQDCPDRVPSKVRVWSPEAGWSELARLNR